MKISSNINKIGKIARKIFLGNGTIGFNPDYVLFLEKRIEELEMKQKILIQQNDGQIAMSFIKNQKCPFCNGSGNISENSASKYSKKTKCEFCNGSGKEYKETTLEKIQ